MAGSSSRNASKNLYQVIDVKKSAPPEGMDGKNWHSYTIKRGSSVITGLKPGTIKTVTAHANQVAADLNARSVLSAGSAFAPRRKS